MAAKFTVDKGGQNKTPVTPRYIPSYAKPTGKTTQQVAKANATAIKSGAVPKPTNVTTGSKAGIPQKAAPAPSFSSEWTSKDLSSTLNPPAGEPVQVLPPVEPIAPVEEAVPVVEETPYSVYSDPFYQQALQGAQSQFNLERASAEANKQYEQRGIQRQLDERPQTAEAQRRRLAGNYAARGMAGGRAGALTRAEADMNAREITARTGLREQMAELNRQFVSQFGAAGTDWLGTLRGSQAQQAAIQTALQNRLAGMTTVG